MQPVRKQIDIDHCCHDAVNLSSMTQCVEIERTFSNEDVKYIERMTVGQAENVIWVEERLTRLTASTFGDEFCLKNVSLINHWGRKQGAAAQLKYKIVLQYPDIKIRECGLCVGTNTLFIGESPDGIIEYTDDGKKLKGVLEIKCPASDK